MAKTKVKGAHLGDQGKAQSAAIVSYREHLQRSHDRQGRERHCRFSHYSSPKSPLLIWICLNAVCPA